MRLRSFVSATHLLGVCAFASACFAQAPPTVPPEAPRSEVFFQRGPGGPRGPGPRGFGGEIKLVEQFDTDRDGRLNAEERHAAREHLKTSRSAGRVFGPGRPGSLVGGPGGPDGLSPVSFLVQPLLAAIDANADAKLSKEEMATGLKEFFALCDQDSTGTLDEAHIADGINRLLPPPSFPGGPPPGGESPILPDRPEPRDPPSDDGPRPAPSADRPDGPRGFRFGSGNMFAMSVIQRADADRDAKLTSDELTASADALFMEWDEDKDGMLDETELVAALAVLAPAPRGFEPSGGFGPGGREPGNPGPRVSPDEVKTYSAEDLYDPAVLRTFFLEFENNDWEAELADFHGTDVEVPATLTVDGRTYPGVGVHFRGMSSFGMVPAGSKRSLNVAVDFEDPTQRLCGYKTLNLLNANGDPSFMSTALYSHIARHYIPAPKANFVKVVINGESWGVYANVQQFNKQFLAENFKSDKGARWKVSGSPGGDGGLNYVGDDIAEYKRRYEIKSKDDDEDWQALIELCRTLSDTPTEELEAKLSPILDIESLLWFLALDVTLINSDGYWVRASDYSIFRDDDGQFHILPHDMNEAFHGAMGPGFGGPGGPGGPGRPGGRPLLDRPPDEPGEIQPEGGEPRRDRRSEGALGRRQPGSGGPFGPGGFGGRGSLRGGVELDPLVGMDDPRKPLRSRVLAVPRWREKYLEHVRTIADEWLDWRNLGAVVAQCRSVIESEIEADTRKLSSFEAFQAATADAPATDPLPDSRRGISLRAFADQRRAYLLGHEEIKRVTP